MRNGAALDRPAGMLETAKGFRRLKAHRQLPFLKGAPLRRRELVDGRRRR